MVPAGYGHWLKPCPCLDFLVLFCVGVLWWDAGFGSVCLSPHCRYWRAPQLPLVTFTTTQLWPRYSALFPCCTFLNASPDSILLVLKVQIRYFPELVFLEKKRAYYLCSGNTLALWEFHAYLKILSHWRASAQWHPVGSWKTVGLGSQYLSCGSSGWLVTHFPHPWSFIKWGIDFDHNPALTEICLFSCVWMCYSVPSDLILCLVLYTYHLYYGITKNFTPWCV